jgi:aspartate/methionine/tyrosine aminotransferase
MNFEQYPFEKLSSLLGDITPNTKYNLSTLTIGEPQFDTPEFIQKELIKNSYLLNKYPPSKGEDFLKEAMNEFIKKRFNVDLNIDEIIPLFGTKEALFNFPQFYLYDKKEPTIAFSNPFYQIYEGASIASRANIIYLDLLEENNFLVQIDDDRLKKCDLVIINYPNNPTSSIITQNELEKWVQKAIEYDFVLINDECYSEIYFDDDKPISLLSACISANNPSFKNCLVLNSLSKRSSAPGLRSGFIAGDKDILKKYAKYRTYIGCAIPLPLQKASALAWRDEKHVEVFREKYKQNFILAKEILGIDIPKATFYIWLRVKDDLKFTKALYKEQNIKVLPGRFLGRNNIAQDYVRIALVEEPIKTKEVLTRLKDFIDSY